MRKPFTGNLNILYAVQQAESEKELTSIPFPLLESYLELALEMVRIDILFVIFMIYCCNILRKCLWSSNLAVDDSLVFKRIQFKA